MNVDFYELYESEVLASTSLKPGAFICCKDSTNIYMVPTAGAKPVKMAETTKFLTDTERSNILAPINGKQYFCYDTGKMWIYYNNWVCLNPDVYEAVSSWNTLKDKPFYDERNEFYNSTLSNGSANITPPRLN